MSLHGLRSTQDADSVLWDKRKPCAHGTEGVKKGLSGPRDDLRSGRMRVLNCKKILANDNICTSGHVSMHT